jgi:LytS/YehU family sensor histidine kinase
VQPVRVPRWLPFAIAAVIATVSAAAIEWLWGYIDLTLRGLPFDPTALDVATYAWQQTPYRLTISVFAMLAAMQAADVARRDRALRRLQMEQTRVMRATYEARLTALQARVEPRFLFETLSDVERIYEHDPGLGAQVMDELIVYLRAALPTIDDTSSSLEIELVLVRNWLDIMCVRSGDHLTFAITEEAPRDARLPPMLLLPLVQHACEDGADRTRGVFVETARAGARIRITVIGPASAFAPSKPSAAVDAVRDRVDTLYGDTGSLVLQPVLHDRSQAILDIPYERTDRRPR